MFKFFESIANIFKTVVDFVINLFQMLLGLVELIVKGFGFLVRVINELPPFLIPFALGYICLAILFQILNKGS